MNYLSKSMVFDFLAGAHLGSKKELEMTSFLIQKELGFERRILSKEALFERFSGSRISFFLQVFELEKDNILT